MPKNDKVIEKRKRAKNLFNPLQGELDKPLSRSFKEGVSAAIITAGPSKIKKGIDKSSKLINRIKKLFKHGDSPVVNRLQKDQLSKSRKLIDSKILKKVKDNKKK